MKKSPDIDSIKHDIQGQTLGSDLQRNLLELDQRAKKIEKNVQLDPNSPLYSIIRAVRDKGRRLLDESGVLISLPPEEAQTQRMQVMQLKEQLDSMQIGLFGRLAKKSERSRVFKITRAASSYYRDIKKFVGKECEAGGQRLNLSSDLLDTLAGYRFSIGTPPCTRESVRVIEEILFGGTLENLNKFRDVIGLAPEQRDDFDRVVALFEKTVKQSTHYTTEVEKDSFVKASEKFPNLSGAKGMCRTFVSGSADTVERLLKDKCFEDDQFGSTGLHFKGHVPVNATLLREMEQTDGFFVVRCNRVDDNVFSGSNRNILPNVLGKLILIEDSKNSKLSNTTFVMAFDPDITEGIDVVHTKEMGTHANSQMNLRFFLEDFSKGSIDGLIDKIEIKLGKLKDEIGSPLDLDTLRRTQTLQIGVSDYVNLSDFRDFLLFLQKLRSFGDEEKMEEFERFSDTLVRGNEDLYKKYFFKALSPDFEVSSVAMGGGREGLYLTGQWLGSQFRQNIAEFVQTGKLEQAKAQILDMKRKDSGEFTRNAVVAEKLEADARRERGQTYPRFDSFKGLFAGMEAKAKAGFIAKLIELENRMKKAEVSVNGVAAENWLKELQNIFAESYLAPSGLGAAKKMLERAKFYTSMKIAEGAFRALFSGGPEQIASKIRKFRVSMLEYHSTDFAEKIVSDIENRNQKNRMATAEAGWTFSDVFGEYDFPADGKVIIDVKNDGSLDVESLTAKLEKIEDELSCAPELFELFCSGVMLVFNDPHNPSGKVASTADKIMLLNIAGKYGIPIVSDESYRGMISAEVKRNQGLEDGDVSLAHIYEQYRKTGAVRHPVKIFVCQADTKNLIGAGLRVGIVASNEKVLTDGLSFDEFMKKGTNPHLMSLCMDASKLTAGLLVKKISSRIEALVMKCALNMTGVPVVKPWEELDRIIGENFPDPADPEFFGPLFLKLCEARNHCSDLSRRDAPAGEYHRYLSQLREELKRWRLERFSRNDALKRLQAASEAIDEYNTETGSNLEYIKPDGTFYTCFVLDSNKEDQVHLVPFAKELAGKTGVDFVPDHTKNWVRISLGGELDGSEESYHLLKTKIKESIKIFLKYWNAFLEEKSRLNKEGSTDPAGEALRAILVKGGSPEQLVADYGDFLVVAGKIGLKRKAGNVVNPFTSKENRIFASLSPQAPALTAQVGGMGCNGVEEVLRSRDFAVIFNFYLKRIKKRIPEVANYEDDVLLSLFGATSLGLKFKSRQKLDQGELEIVRKILMEIAGEWLSDRTMRVLARKHTPDASLDMERDTVLGVSDNIKKFIGELLLAFSHGESPDDGVIKLLESDAFQAGYVYTDEALASSGAHSVVKGLFARQIPLILQSVPTASSPEMVTASSKRRGEHDLGIYRRDSREDGDARPSTEFFVKRYMEFAETLDPNDYVAKMLQIGPMKQLFVLHRSCLHYLAEELRLFPQFELTDAELGRIEPDAVMVFGMPEKIMGDNYKVGYCVDGGVPLGWVAKSELTDYMGYVKKPLLTLHNESVIERGGMPIHGAFARIMVDGIPYTVVMVGDSGAGKSETLTALEAGVKDMYGMEVEVQLLAGDMGSLWRGEDGFLYGIGTESGDFFRLKDAPPMWVRSYKDRLSKATTSNKEDLNARSTIPGLCNPEQFLRPNRVDLVLYIDNSTRLKGSERAVAENTDPRDLIAGKLYRFARIEKATSADQPGLRECLAQSDHPMRDKILAMTRGGEFLDEVFSWKLMSDKNSVLQFNDKRTGNLSGQNGSALSLAKALFVKGAVKGAGVLKETETVVNVESWDADSVTVVTESDLTKKKSIKKIPHGVLGGEQLRESLTGKKLSFEWSPVGVRYDVQKNEYFLELEREDKGGVNGERKKEVKITRSVFARYFKSIVVTRYGNPFMETLDPGIAESVARTAYGDFVPDEVLAKVSNLGVDDVAGMTAEEKRELKKRYCQVLTGTLFTQLGVEGKAYEGPAAASKSLIEFLKKNDRLLLRRNNQEKVVQRSLLERYGQFGKNVNREVRNHNLLLLNQQNEGAGSDGASSIKLVHRESGEGLDVKTPLYHFDEKCLDRGFNPSIISPDMKTAIESVCSLEDLNNSEMIHMDERRYQMNIRYAANREELIYQILLMDGKIMSSANQTALVSHDVKVAEYKAGLLSGEVYPFDNGEGVDRAFEVYS